MLDRRAKLSRLRFLLAELVEQRKEPDFDTAHWSEIVTAMQDIEQLSSDLELAAPAQRLSPAQWYAHQPRSRLGLRRSS